MLHNHLNQAPIARGRFACFHRASDGQPWRNGYVYASSPAVALASFKAVTPTARRHYVVADDATQPAPTLTLESAKAYVTAYHHKCGATAVDVEGCGFVDAQTVRLNVTTTDAQGEREPFTWDVWIEPGVGLYGEC